MDNIVDSLTCSICLYVISNPVSTIDGHSYCSDCIDLWFAEKVTSPATGLALTSSARTPNHALRRVLDAMQSVRPANVQASATSSGKLALRYEQGHGVMSAMVTPFSGEPHFLPTGTIFVLDVSWSMRGWEVRDTTNRELVTAFSPLDLLKHSVRTFIALARATDVLAIVLFSDEARVALQPTTMDREGKVKALAAVRSMTPERSTNLWAGLENGVELADVLPDHLLASVVLLTDGAPTPAYNPGRGIVGAFLERHGRMKRRVAFHTVGYGMDPSLDSYMLCEIARIGHGSFSFISDLSMVGTVFTHLACNMNSAIHPGVRFLSEVDDLHSGPLRNMQRHVFKHDQVAVAQLNEADAAMIETVSQQYDMPDTFLAVCFLQFVKLLGECIHAMEVGDATLQTQKLLISFADRLAIEYPGDPRAAALIKDVSPSADADSGQINKGLTHWNTWGKHYLRSVLSAHTRQEKVNFKDASLAMYSTPEFETMVRKAERVFAAIPPPAGTYAKNTVPMTAYVNPNGGCLAPRMRVKMADGTARSVDTLRKGDVLLSGAKVVCVVMMLNTGCTSMFTSVFGGGHAEITAYHPVRMIGDGKWYFPCDVLRQVDVDPSDTTLYNLLLDSVHIVETEGAMDCVTLAHGLTSDDVVAHPYFGTGLCVNDLEKMDGFEEGKVVYHNAVFHRDQETGLVFKITEGQGDVV